MGRMTGLKTKLKAFSSQPVTVNHRPILCIFVSIIFRAKCPFFKPPQKIIVRTCLQGPLQQKTTLRPSLSPSPTFLQVLPQAPIKNPLFQLKFLLYSPNIILIFEMHRQQKLGNFISKLQYLLTRQEYSEIICWDKTKTIIEVLSEERMEAQIIPLYFRHQKFQSFVRQLNLYGFKKVKSSGRHRFTHPLLLEGEKLLSITSHKMNSSRKDGKQEGKDSPFSENTQQRRDGEGKKEKNLPSSLNSITQFQKNANTPTCLGIETTTNNQTLPQEMPQLVPAYPQPYLNYWNMMLIHAGNQFTPVFFINSLPTSE